MEPGLCETEYELHYGAFKSRRVEHNAAFVDQLQFEGLAFDQEDARQAGCMRAQLSKQGTPIGSCIQHLRMGNESYRLIKTRPAAA